MVLCQAIIFLILLILILYRKNEPAEFLSFVLAYIQYTNNLKFSCKIGFTNITEGFLQNKSQGGITFGNIQTTFLKNLKKSNNISLLDVERISGKLFCYLQARVGKGQNPEKVFFRDYNKKRNFNK